MLAQLQIRDIRSLQVFVAIVEAGGVTAAQESLGMTQSNISNQLIELETRLGIVLCERGRRGFRLTSEGEEVYTTALSLMADLGDYQDRFQSISGGLRGELLVGHMDNYLGHPECPLVPVLTRLAEQSPHIFFNLRSAPLGALTEMLLSATLQVAIGTFTRFSDEVDYRQMHSERQVLCCAAQHSLLINRSTLSPEDVSATGYVQGLFAQGAESELLTHCVASAHQVESMVAIILSGRAIGYLPEQIAAPWIAEGQMVSLLPDYFSRDIPVYLAVRRKSMSSPVVQLFVEQCLAL